MHILSFMMQYWRMNLLLQINVFERRMKINSSKGLSRTVGTNFFLVIGTALVLSFSSCKEDSVVGLGALPANDLLNIGFVDTASIIAYTVRYDSIIASQTKISLLGSYNDPVFGESRASIYTQFRFPANVSLNPFGPGTLICDSLVLTLPYSGSYYGTLDSQTLEVYRINEDMNKDSIYFSNKSFAVSTLLATQTFTPAPNTKVFIDGDSLVPHLRIKLDPTFGQQLLVDASTSMTNSDALLAAYKGLYIKATTTGQASGEGAILYFDLLSSLSRLTVYYHQKPSSFGEKYNVKNYSFEINSSCARVTQVSHDYSAATAINTQLTDSTLGQNVVYLQDPAGLKTRILFPFINNFIESGKIAINKAELVFRIDQTVSATNYPNHSSLALGEIDSTGKINYLKDDLYLSSTFGGGVDANKEYKFNISLYIQELLNGKKQYGLYLLGGDGNIITATRTAIGGPKNSTYPMKLRLTYTKIN